MAIDSIDVIEGFRLNDTTQNDDYIWERFYNSRPIDVTFRVPVVFTCQAQSRDRMLGFHPTNYAPNPVFIHSVDPNTFADRQGVLKGDEVTRIQNLPLGKMKKAEFINSLTERPLDLTFLRHNPIYTQMKLTIIAEEFYRMSDKDMINMLSPAVHLSPE